MTTDAQVEGVGEFARWGFTLDHVIDDEVLLMHEGEQIASFLQTAATERSLQAECARHLAKRHGYQK